MGISFSNPPFPIVTGTGTFNGSVPAGQTVDYTFSAPGAIAGKPVSTSIQGADIAPLTIQNRRAGTDTLTISLINADQLLEHDPTGVTFSFIIFNQ